MKDCAFSQLGCIISPSVTLLPLFSASFQFHFNAVYFTFAPGLMEPFNILNKQVLCNGLKCLGLLLSRLLIFLCFMILPPVVECVLIVPIIEQGCKIPPL